MSLFEIWLIYSLIHVAIIMALFLLVEKVPMPKPVMEGVIELAVALENVALFTTFFGWLLVAKVLIFGKEGAA